MAANKTQPTEVTVGEFLAGVEPPRRAEDGQRLDQLFHDVTGYEPRMWGPSIVGYGRYHYVYASGREGDFLATGFSPRKAALSICNRIFSQPLCQRMRVARVGLRTEAVSGLASTFLRPFWTVALPLIGIWIR